VKKYQLIYADPPWKYSFSKSDSRQIENHYPTMETSDICAMAVPSDKNCVLYLWTTAPKLLEGLAVLKAWGFEYKSQAVWDKEILGMGYWFRGQHEILLVGTKGKVSPPEQPLRVSSVFKYRRNKHSKKPNEIREYLKRAHPDIMRLEMFARQTDDGWDVFGNETDKFTQDK
jgi:N6-adenosine-specific RNA methylase IME4